jgi:hypothetical protein
MPPAYNGNSKAHNNNYYISFEIEELELSGLTLLITIILAL